jgi:serine/threonine protein kinase
MRELEALAGNEHPATLRLLGYSLMPDPDRGEKGPIFILPLMPSGGLDTMIDADLSGTPVRGWTPTAKSKCVFGIAAGMAYLHSKQVMHRDLRPANVLIDANFEPVVAGFGLSRSCDNDLTRTMTITPKGSHRFMAPEMLNPPASSGSPAYGLPIDVYSFAMLLYNMFCSDSDLQFATGRPVRDDVDLCHRVTQGLRYKRPATVTPFYWELIEKCWSHAPQARPTFNDIVEEFRATHAYAFRDTNMDELLAYEERIMQFAPDPLSVPVPRSGHGKWVVAILIVLLAFGASLLQEHLGIFDPVLDEICLNQQHSGTAFEQLCLTQGPSYRHGKWVAFLIVAVLLFLLAIVLRLLARCRCKHLIWIVAVVLLLIAILQSTH